MEETELPDDVVHEILLRAPTDAAALFRCAATCKQWRAVVADVSFLAHHWPENTCHPSSLLGFFDWRHRVNQEPDTYFIPVSPAGSVLGSRRRSLGSFIGSDAPEGILDDAVPVAARGSLLLVHLVAASRDSLRFAVCDILTGTCDMLPPLKCWVSKYRCAILARQDCSSFHGQTPLTGYSTFFKVLAIVTIGTDKDFSLYTFSSSKPNWSEPRKCFDQVWRYTFGVEILTGMTDRVAVCHGVAYWLGSYSRDEWSLTHYFTFGVNVKTDQISVTKISIPVDQLAEISYFGLTLSATDDGRLSLLNLQRESPRLNTWTEGDDGTWLCTRVTELKSPRQAVWNPVHVTMSSREKSGILLMSNVCGRVHSVHKTDVKTGVIEDVMTKMSEDGLSITAVPIEIDWPALFMSRLAKGYDQ